MSAADILARAADKEATEEALKALLALIDKDRDEARRVLWVCEKHTRALHRFHVRLAESHVQLGLCQRLAAIGAFEHMSSATFKALTQRPHALTAFVRGAAVGGQSEGLARLVTAWIEEELTPERLDAAAKDGGRHSETSGVQRAAESLADSLNPLPPELYSTARNAIARVLDGSPSPAAHMFKIELDSILATRR